MNRVDVAYAMLALFVLGVAIVSVTTVRFTRYRRAILHGRRVRHSVWKPFWMD